MITKPTPCDSHPASERKRTPSPHFLCLPTSCPATLLRITSLLFVVGAFFADRPVHPFSGHSSFLACRRRLLGRSTCSSLSGHSSFVVCRGRLLGRSTSLYRGFPCAYWRCTGNRYLVPHCMFISPQHLRIGLTAMLPAARCGA